MTDLLEHAMDRVRMLPPEVQDEVARIVLSFTDDDALLVELTPEEDAAITRSMEAAERGEFATDAQVLTVWAKHGL